MGQWGENQGASVGGRQNQQKSGSWFVVRGGDFSSNGIVKRRLLGVEARVKLYARLMFMADFSA